MLSLRKVLAAAADVQAFCRAEKWDFCFIGGVAVVRWGFPRLTHDVDLTLLTGFGAEERYLDRLLQRYAARDPDARAFALRHRVALLRTDSGIDLDFALGAIPFEERSVARASIWESAEDPPLFTCSAEDLIVHKVFAGRERDWSDVETILTRQTDKLVFDQIISELQPLLELKENLQAMEKLKRMRQEVERRLRSK